MAVALRRAGRDVLLWVRESEIAQSINQRHVNEAFLPGVALDPAIRATHDLAEIAASETVLLVTPSQFLRSVAKELSPHLAEGTPVAICAKGIEQNTLLMMTEVVAETLPQARQAVLSGPTFAIEVARGQPTAITLACADSKLGQALVAAIGTPTFRPYLSDDPIGAEIGGAVKNVLAIACGVVEGKGFGDNARAALITRGLAEIARLARAKGGKPETLMGLSGLGDLILTASSKQSRNFSVGAALGRGEKLSDYLAGRKSVAEGVFSAPSVLGLAERLGVEMPICASVDALLHQGADIDAIVGGLLSRPFKSE